MINSMFIYKGSKPNSVAMALELTDENKATVVESFEFSKDDNEVGVINLVNFTYGKDEKGTNAPDYKWVSKALSEKNLLYLNKKRAPLDFKPLGATSLWDLRTSMVLFLIQV